MPHNRRRTKKTNKPPFGAANQYDVMSNYRTQPDFGNVRGFLFLGYEPQVWFQWLGDRGPSVYAIQIAEVGDLASSQTCKVTFQDYNGTVLRSDQYNVGDIIKEPSAPYRTGYEFTGWYPELTSGTLATQDQIYTAQYKELNMKKYTVMFKDYDGSVILSNEYYEGEIVTAPISPIRDGYTFTGWSPSFVNGTTANSNMEYIAQYTQNDQETANNENTYDDEIQLVSPKKLRITKTTTTTAKISWPSSKNALKYEIRYSYNKNFKTGTTKIIFSKKTNIMLKNLKNGMKYYVRIRAINNTNKSKWSKTITFKTKK